VNTDEFKTALAKPITDLIDERNKFEDEMRAYRSIFDFLTGYSSDDFPRLLGVAAKALGGRQAEIAAEHIERAQRPREVVRQDIGGWISGPCLDVIPATDEDGNYGPEFLAALRGES
jgi:hypothetical protein